MSGIEGISSYAGCEKAKELLLFYNKMKNFILGMNKFDFVCIFDLSFFIFYF